MSGSKLCLGFANGNVQVVDSAAELNGEVFDRAF
jgi:hypothetical protein